MPEKNARMKLFVSHQGVNCYGLGVFFDGISGAAITMKYNQMHAELMRNKKLSDKIATLKKQLLNI